MASVVSLPGTCRSITVQSAVGPSSSPIWNGGGFHFLRYGSPPRAAFCPHAKTVSSPTGFRPSSHQHHHPCLFTSCCAPAPCRSFRSDRVPALVSKKMEAYTPHEEKMIFVTGRRLIYPSCFARLGLVQPRARLVQCR